MIFKTNIQIDINRALLDLDKIVQFFDNKNQLAITYDPDRPPYDLAPHLSAIGKSPIDIDQWNLSTVCPIFKDSYFYEILQNLPYTVQRARLMRMAPKTTYSMHVDTYKRLHFALITNPGCHLSFQSGDKFFGWHIPADGHAYIADTTKLHSAVNPWDQNRYHMVVDIKT